MSLSLVFFLFLTSPLAFFLSFFYSLSLVFPRPCWSTDGGETHHFLHGTLWWLFVLTTIKKPLNNWCHHQHFCFLFSFLFFLNLSTPQAFVLRTKLPSWAKQICSSSNTVMAQTLFETRSLFNSTLAARLSHGAPTVAFGQHDTALQVRSVSPFKLIQETYRHLGLFLYTDAPYKDKVMVECPDQQSS